MAEDQGNIGAPQQSETDPDKEAFKADGLDAVRTATAERASHSMMSFADFERGIEALLHHVAHWRRPATAANAFLPQSSESAHGDEADAGQTGSASAAGFAAVDQHAQDIQALKPPESASDG